MGERMKVMVGIPTMTNRITIQVAGFLDALREASREPDSGIEIKYTMSNGKAPVDYARNVIVGTFLRTDCEKLFFIDEDMLPAASATRLLFSDADVICARMYKFDHENPEIGIQVGLGLCAMMRKPNGLYSAINPKAGDPAVQDADAVGTACTVIHRRVLEDRRMWFDNVYTTADGKVIDGNEMTESGEWAPAVFRVKRAPSGMPIMGEDVDFCERAKALGYTVKSDLNAICGHWKTIDIDQAGTLAQAVLSRAVNGVKPEEGKILKLGVIEEKEVAAPPVQRAVQRDFTLRRRAS